MGKYIDQLTTDDIINFLDENNYILLTHLKDRDGNLLPAIERDEDAVFIRCKKTSEHEQSKFNKEVAYYLMKKYRGFSNLSLMLSEQYSSRPEIMYLKDYFMTTLPITDYEQIESEDLNEKYVKMMYQKFKKDGYLEDYNAYFANLQKEQDENVME